MTSLVPLLNWRPQTPFYYGWLVLVVCMVACVSAEQPTPMPTACVTLEDDHGRRELCFTKPTPLPFRDHVFPTGLGYEIVRAQEEAARREAEGEPRLQPEDSERVEVRVVIDHWAGYYGTAVARWLMDYDISYHYHGPEYDEVVFSAAIPILLLPELSERSGVRNIEHLRPPVFIITPVPPPTPVPPLPGALIFASKGQCWACHTLEHRDIRRGRATGILGPPLDHIGTDAAPRIPGMSAEDYLRESIIDPDAFLSKGYGVEPDRTCAPGLMEPLIEAADLTDAEVDALVDFLLNVE